MIDLDSLDHLTDKDQGQSINHPPYQKSFHIFLSLTTV
jgi:hypothetical protein